MKFTLDHIHRNSATDRTQDCPHATARSAALALSVLISLPALAPTVAALAAPADGETTHAGMVEVEIQNEIPLSPSILHVHALPFPTAPADVGEEPTDELCGEATKNETVNSAQGTADVPARLPESDMPDTMDSSLPLTQERIALCMETKMDMQVRSGTRIHYPYPAGAMAVDLYKDGQRILKGQVADIGGTVYVPVQRFADLFGNFKTVYTEATEQVVITGKNLSITVKVGDPYITVNDRIFYTGKKVISLGGWIFVPLTSMCKALDADVTIRSGYYDAFITSGDPTTVAKAEDFYNQTDLYWLARIISAEAKGEPFAGQIAVGNVVLNRVRSNQFPNTVKGVIFDTKYGTQFSPVASGTIYQAPTASAIRAAKVCLEGYSLSTRMIYFYNPAIATSSWIGRTRPYIMTIGNHKFYA